MFLTLTPKLQFTSTRRFTLMLQMQMSEKAAEVEASPSWRQCIFSISVRSVSPLLADPLM